jgi:hypothetical protein
MTKTDIQYSSRSDIFAAIQAGTVSLEDFEYYMDLVETRIAAQAYSDARSEEDLGWG